MVILQLSENLGNITWFGFYYISFVKSVQIFSEQLPEQYNKFFMLVRIQINSENPKNTTDVALKKHSENT